ncbi:MAG: hypothetical protein AB8B81_15645 [Halioglobus sp.]
MMYKVCFKAVFAVVALILSVAAVAEARDCALVIHPACGNTPSAAFDRQGKLWIAFEQRDRVYVTSSTDLGHSFADAVAVNAIAEPIYARGENRPKLVHGPNGKLFVSWTRKLANRFSGDIRFSRSLNGGKSFETPLTVNDDGLQISHRFDALKVTPSGKVFLTWLDKRDKVKLQSEGKNYPGAALYYAVSEDRGASFKPNIKVADNSCECCRIAIANYRQDKVAVMWRHIFEGGIRDHALAILGADKATAPVRATVDDWQIDACPHHGPDIALSSDGMRYHMTWFTNGKLHKGLYYGRMSPGNAQAEGIISLDTNANASHPQVAVNRNTVFLLWKHFDGEKTELKLMKSTTDGSSWGEPKSTVATTGASDHPQLLQHGDRTYAGWHTQNEGYRLVQL